MMTLTSVIGDRTTRRTDDATVTVSLGKKDFVPISGNITKRQTKRLDG